MTAEFISIDFLKAQTVISGNVDAEELKPWIIQAQDVYIQDILGSNLYNTLSAEIIAESVSTVNETLLNKIAPALAYYTFYLALPFLMIKVKNKGLLKNNDPITGSISAELREMQFLRDEVMTMAQFHGERIVTFLCNYSSDYPTYLNAGSKPDVIAKGTAYDHYGFSTFDSGLSSSEAERRIINKYFGQ